MQGSPKGHERHCERHISAVQPRVQSQRQREQRHHGDEREDEEGQAVGAPLVVEAGDGPPQDTVYPEGKRYQMPGYVKNAG